MTFYFGLNINRNLTDIENPTQALLNINLDIKDLERIRGVTDPGGVTRTDFKTLSGLTNDLERTLGSLSTESSTYDVLTTNSYDENSYVDNNLIINGQLAATSIKYVYLDSDNLIKIADISTSRVSSWSSFESPVTASTPIFYGGEVELDSPIELSDLIVDTPAEPKRFAAEIPTHKIKIKVDGTDVFLYAMKGIPLVFRGFFRTASLIANVSAISGIAPSWTITNVANNFEYVYENRLSGSASRIDFSDSTARERDVRFFYPINNITVLLLPRITLVELPSVNLTSLTTLDISNNDFREFPNLSGYVSLATLNIANNNVTRAKDLASRQFSFIISRLPSSIRSLTAGNCFTGSGSVDLSQQLPLLTSLNLNAGSRFNRRLSGVSPKVNPSSIEIYNIAANLFTNVDDSVKDSLTLKQIIMSDNSFTNSDMRFDSPEIEIFQSMNNSHNLVDVSNKTKLTDYQFRSNTGSVSGSSTVTNIFNGCVALRTVDISATPITGAFPPFQNCTSLTGVNFLFTIVTDAVPAAGDDPPYVIGENTLNSCRPTLTRLQVRSPNFSASAQFHPDCFRLMPVLDYVEISSNSQGIIGPLPSFATARNITHVLLYNNNLTGLIPNFDSNERLFFLNLSNNFFEGSVPNIKASTFQNLILTNNRLDSFNSIDSTQVTRIHLASNRIRRIPDLSNLTRLQELLINNQQLSGNIFTYTTGSFVGITALNTLNITNNSIGQGFIDQMILDLSKNYDLNPRRGVTINLRGNGSPSINEEVQDALLKLRISGWTVLTE